MPEQKLYALHQPVLILPAQCLCHPIEDEQPTAGEPCAEHRKPVIIQHRKVGKARLPRMLQPKLPQHIGRGKRFQPCRTAVLLPVRGRSAKRQHKIAHGQLPARKAGFVHQHGVLPDPVLDHCGACLAAAAEGASVRQCKASLEKIQICSTGGQILIHIYADALATGNRDIKPVFAGIAAEYTMLNAYQFFLHVTPPAAAAAV